MLGTYSLELVALSIVVAVIASYTALDLATRVSTAQGARAAAWLVGGAAALGAGIWSMHFIAMLAFRLPVPVAYDVPITLLSLVFAILASALALYTLKWRHVKTAAVVASATLIGIGICAMHYTGMLAMRMSPPIQYQPVLFVTSVLIAISAAFGALYLGFTLRHRRSGLAILAKLGSAVVMGIAIAGMHYTGMAATHFAPDSICLAVDSARALDPAGLAVIVGTTTLIILLGTLVLSSIDSHSAARTARLVETLSDANRQLRSVALHDALTGLPNRVLLQDRLEQAMRRAERSGRQAALMFVDLDRFKPVNDNHGHDIGDLLLKQVATRLCAAVRKEDTVARPGGDEFVVVLPEIAAVEDAAVVARKMVADLSRPFAVQEYELEISCSVGVSLYPQDAADIAGLIRNADAAMYRMKSQGRNGVLFFTPEMTQPEARTSGA